MKTNIKQMELKSLGYYDGELDNSFGHKSKNATKAFQKDFNLDVDGSFGVNTANKAIEVVSLYQRHLNSIVGANLSVDGLAGNSTQKATGEFQKKYGMQVNNKLDYPTRLKILEIINKPNKNEIPCNFNTITYFAREEFRCGCHGKYCNGFPVEMKQVTVDVADRARKYFGAEAIVSSGVRCIPFNDSLKRSVKNSPHEYGKAIDLRIVGVRGTALKNWLKKQSEVSYTYIISGDWVHFNIK